MYSQCLRPTMPKRRQYQKSTRYVISIRCFTEKQVLGLLYITLHFILYSRMPQYVSRHGEMLRHLRPAFSHHLLCLPLWTRQINCFLELTQLTYYKELQIDFIFFDVHVYNISNYLDVDIQTDEMYYQSGNRDLEMASLKRSIAINRAKSGSTRKKRRKKSSTRKVKKIIAFTLL